MAAGRRTLLPLLAIVLALAPLAAQAQTGVVAGRVFDIATDQPLAGVSISVAGRSTIAGTDGRFLLTGVPAGEHAIDFNMLGYRALTQTVEVVSGQTATVNVGLSPEAIALERMVVTGYGQRRAGDITGSVERIGEEQFNVGRIISPEELIQGRVAGLQVIDTGEPGGGIQIRIRGGTSVTASSEPLFVIDGIPMPTGGGLSSGRNPLNFLNPDDIASMTVLKDASATAIYGSRGANGVIFIETRRGSLREPQFTYTGSFSSSVPGAGPTMLTTQQFRETVQSVTPHRVGLLGDADTDWRDAVLRAGVGQEHSVSMAGAADNLTYRLSLGYLGQEGIIRGSMTERLSLAAVATQRLLDDRMNIRASIRGARTDDQYTPGGGLGSATIFDPTQPIRAATGEFFEQPRDQLPLSPTNPIAELEHGREEGTTYRSIGSIETEYLLPFVDNLTATARLGYDVAASERRTFYPTFLEGQQRSAMPGYFNRSNPRETTGLFDLFFTHRAVFDASDLETTAGYSYETSRGDYPFFAARGLESDLLGLSGVPVAEEQETNLWVSERKLASFFARAHYTLNDRYLFSASVRRDGSSRFGPGNQWGTFPAAAFAWRLSEENFMAGFDAVSDLKLRVSWGVNGNQAFADYAWVPDYRYGDEFTQVQFGDEWVTTIRPTAVDPNIKWEETTSYNIGLDYGFRNNRFTGAVDFYVKDTDDLIFRIPVAAGTFLSNYVTTNVGSMRNVGLELALNADVLQATPRGGLTWTASLTASTNRNELLSIDREGGEQIDVGGIAGGVGGTIQVLRPGYPINSFFVYTHRMGEDGRPVPTGTLAQMYQCPPGEEPPCTPQRAPTHTPDPTWMFGHASQFGYGNFGLGFSMRAHLGNYVYNNLASFSGYYNRLNEAAGPVNLHASVGQNRFQAAQFYSDVYVENAAFLRMDNLTLDYRLPQFRGTQQVRVFGTIQNVFTLTGYSGVDPEAGLMGIDNNIYPRARTFTTGASVVF